MADNHITKEAVVSLPPEFNISARGLLNHAVQARRDKDDAAWAAREGDGPRPRFWASEVCADCPRRAIYARAKVTPTVRFTPRELCRFALGNIIEEWARSLIAEGLEATYPGWGWVDVDSTKAQQNILHATAKEGDFYARTDGILKPPGGTVVIPVEIKTIAAKSLRYGLPNDHNIRQLGLWMYLAAEAGQPISIGRLFYVVKDDGRVFEFGVAMTDKLADWISIRVKTLRGYWGEGPGKGGQMPARPVNNPTELWECAQNKRKRQKGPPMFVPRCAWFHTCWASWLERHDHKIAPPENGDDDDYSY